MNFDVYYNIGEETKVDGNETIEKSTRKNFKNISAEEAKKIINELFDNIPENANHIWLNVEKTYEDRLDDALRSI